MVGILGKIAIGADQCRCGTQIGDDRPLLGLDENFYRHAGKDLQSFEPLNLVFRQGLRLTEMSPDHRHGG